MFNEDRIDLIEPQDGIGLAYDDLVKMAQAAYWVIPINTDSERFAQYWRIADRGESGKVHYERRRLG